MKVLYVREKDNDWSCCDRLITITTASFYNRNAIKPGDGSAREQAAIWVRADAAKEVHLM